MHAREKHSATQHNLMRTLVSVISMNQPLMGSNKVKTSLHASLCLEEADNVIRLSMVSPFITWPQRQQI
jgi:hypothetical protein